MGLIPAFTGALGGTFADQWKDTITAGHFGESTVVAPGVRRAAPDGRGNSFRGSPDVISNGSKILVPENTAAFIFSQGGVEEIVTTPGGYEYFAGQASVFDGDGIMESIVRQTAERFTFGGQTPDQTWVAFVNLREIRGLRFGTRAPMVYHDRFYSADLEIMAYGTFSVRVVDAVAFVRNFLPANTRSYAFDSAEAQRQLASEFIQAFLSAVNALSAEYRMAELPAQGVAIANLLADDGGALGSWSTRFGLEVVQVGIESIEFSPQSRELVRRFTGDRMSMSAFEGISQQASNVMAQQKIAQGIQDHGLGDTPGLVLGMGLVQGLSPQTAAPSAPAAATTGQATSPSLDEQIESVKKLKELLDAGVLTQEEFDAKKKQVMGL